MHRHRGIHFAHHAICMVNSWLGPTSSGDAASQAPCVWWGGSGQIWLFSSSSVLPACLSALSGREIGLGERLSILRVARASRSTFRRSVGQGAALPASGTGGGGHLNVVGLKTHNTFLHQVGRSQINEIGLVFHSRLHCVLGGPITRGGVVLSLVVLQLVSDVWHQRVLRIWVGEQRANAKQDLGDGQCWRPL